MAKIWQIEKALDALAPRETALSYDNVGLLVGDGQADARTALLALDITPQTALEAREKGAQLIVSHHPVIFTPFRHITPEKYDTEAVRRLLLGGIAAICMHTNLDLARGGVNDALAQALGLENVQAPPCDEAGLLRVGTLAESMDMADFAAYVKNALHAPGLWYLDAGKPVRTVAVCGGAGGGDEETAVALACGADVYVSAEFRHHITLQARYRGMSLVDAGHFYTERPVLETLKRYLSGLFPELMLLISAQDAGLKYLSD